MKYYFTLISNNYRAEKNKLETAAKEATREASHRLVSNDDVIRFMNEFGKRIKALNKTFPWCKPLSVSIEPLMAERNGHKKHSTIWIEGVCNMDFYPAKNEL